MFPPALATVRESGAPSSQPNQYVTFVTFCPNCLSPASCGTPAPWDIVMGRIQNEASAYRIGDGDSDGSRVRRAGWRGQGPIPWSHEPNRGFLRSLAALATASERIGEGDEATRCRTFLRDAAREAADALGL